MKPIATTRIIAMHKNKGKTIANCLTARIAYAKNPEKTKNQELISSFECDPHTADAEFLLSKRQYLTLTGRDRENDVIAYQIRQSFKPGEVTPEEANKIGYELAMRFLKGKHAFLVCTHVDKEHIHSHIIFNSTTLDCTHKFRDFLGSGRAVARLSDIICVEHGLSIIENPKRSHSSYDKWRAKIANQKTSLLIDIEAKLREGKGKGYERWAKVFNLKQMAQTLNYLRENGLLELSELEKRTSDVTSKYHELSDKIKSAESRIKEISELKTQIINFAKTREVYAEYKKSGYSKSFLAEHESEILLHKTAKKAFDELKIQKLPTIKSLNAEFYELVAEKKRLYREYSEVRNEMRELLIHKANVERILGVDTGEKRSEHER